MSARILGLEVELGLSFLPSPCEGPLPTQREIYEVLVQSLRALYPAAKASYKKEGIFLENGGLFHREAQITHFQHGLVEYATPECRTPRQAVLYSRALERQVTSALPLAEERLEKRGYRGRILLNKSNVDSYGNDFGTHENYRVEEPLRAHEAPAAVLAWAVYAASIGLLSGVLFLLFLGFLAGGILVTLAAAALRVLSKLPILGPFPEALHEGIRRRFEKVRTMNIEEVGISISLVLTRILRPLSRLLTLFIRGAYLRRTRREVLPFLVTRPVLTGAGNLWVDGREARFVLSQKAPYLRSICKVYWDDRDKPIFDAKNVIFEPLMLFRRHKRVHLFCGDANLCEVADLLKLGVTTAVLKMIEGRGVTAPIRLADPLGALQAINKDPSLRERVRLRNGESLTAIEIQRRYLGMAKGFFRRPDPEDSTDYEAILDLWEKTLDALERDPSSLFGILDWVTKKRLMDEAIGLYGSWEDFLRDAPRAAVAEGIRPGEALRPSPEGVFEAAPPSGGKGPPDGGALLFAQVMKINLKYHDLRADEGYYGALRQKRLARPLVTEEEVETAVHEPPRGTRAEIRGRYIRWAAQAREEIHVNWNRIRLPRLRRTIVTKDPLQGLAPPEKE